MALFKRFTLNTQYESRIFYCKSDQFLRHEQGVESPCHSNSLQQFGRPHGVGAGLSAWAAPPIAPTNTKLASKIRMTLKHATFISDLTLSGMKSMGAPRKRPRRFQRPRARSGRGFLADFL
jgi:hypothetical protein